MDHQALMAQIGGSARAAGRAVARTPARQRDGALRGAAAQIRASRARIEAANGEDLTAAAAAGVAGAMLDRLELTPARIEAMATSLEEIAAFPDPVGDITRMWTRPNGLKVGKMRIPLGVIAMVYESRPNVTAEAGGLCLKAGNAVILRGGKESLRSNEAIATCFHGALAEAGLPTEALQVIPTTDRAFLEALLKAEAWIDMLIPRGGEGLIRFVSEHARVPVIKHYKGVCHLFIDDAADIDMGIAICHNAKVQRPGVCNALETLLVHGDVAARFLPRCLGDLMAAGVTVFGDEAVKALVPAVEDASEDDWYAEYLDLALAVRVVADLDEAIAHIERYGSQHTEAIVTQRHDRAMRFLHEVDSSVVMVNASTRFADGGQLGLGAEMGISTTRLHAYGPMGVESLTTEKFVIFGDGQVRT